MRVGRLSVLASPVLLIALLSADAPKSEPADPIVTTNGEISCRAFLRMNYGQKTMYLHGLWEGWQGAAATLRAVGEGSPGPADRVDQTIRTADALRLIVQPRPIVFGEIQKRTEIQCERPEYADTSAWSAWYAGIRESE